MAAPLSQDLRRRLVQAVEQGSSAREGARRFAVSESAVIKFVRRVRETGSTAVERNSSGQYVLDKQPDALSEQYGMRHWRGFVGILNQAGFDVLITDRRGNGVSGGVGASTPPSRLTTCFASSTRCRAGMACEC